MGKIYNGIAIFGEMGSGKDALAEEFSALRDKAIIYKMSVLCREMMKVSKVNSNWAGLERFIGQTMADKFRELDINIMCDYILALIYERGQKKYSWDNSGLEGDAYNQAVLNQLSIIRNDELSIIVGGRTLTDLDYFKSKQYLIVGVKVSPEVRRNRLVFRDGETMVNNSSFHHNTEVDMPSIINGLCDEVIINDGTLEELRNEGEILLRKYNF
jgi:dephospho-CoA kinase